MQFFDEPWYPSGTKLAVLKRTRILYRKTDEFCAIAVVVSEVSAFWFINHSDFVEVRPEFFSSLTKSTIDVETK